MNGILASLTFIMALGIALFVPDGPGAVLVCGILTPIVAWSIYRSTDDRKFLLRVFIAGLLVRMLVGTIIHALDLKEFFGGDASTYDNWGYALLKTWEGQAQYKAELSNVYVGGGWGMSYMVGSVYAFVGRNTLATQFVNAIIGAATAPVIFNCAKLIFQNAKVSRVSALFVAFYPSLVLWSSQGLKDGPIVFLLSVCMLATLKLGERISFKYLLILVCALFGVLTLRFYIFYMLVAAIGGAFLIGMRRVTAQSLVRQFIIIIFVGLSMTYFGVVRTASTQFETYGNLEAVQRSRLDLSQSANSGFAKDVDVSTTSGAISAIPMGSAYLLFAPFPWQLASLRQSITFPEMIVWWCAFPLFVLGLWFTIKYRLRQSLPILIFTSMLTLAYSVFQGNVGTAYRQRSQLLVFYFIFVAVGYVLMKEQREDRQQQHALAAKQLPTLKGRRA